MNSILTRDGGAVSDLKTHWMYIWFLKEDINNHNLYELLADVKQFMFIYLYFFY